MAELDTAAAVLANLRSGVVYDDPLIPILAEEVGRLRAGEDAAPRDEACEATPGQWIRWWNDLSADDRLRWAGHILDWARTTSECLLHNHDARIREIEDLLAKGDPEAEYCAGCGHEAAEHPIHCDAYLDAMPDPDGHVCRPFPVEFPGGAGVQDGTKLPTNSAPGPHPFDGVPGLDVFCRTCGGRYGTCR